MWEKKKVCFALIAFHYLPLNILVERATRIGGICWKNGSSSSTVGWRSSGGKGDGWKSLRLGKVERNTAAMETNRRVTWQVVSRGGGGSEEEAEEEEEDEEHTVGRWDERRRRAPRELRGGMEAIRTNNDEENEWERESERGDGSWKKSNGLSDTWL